MSQNRRNKRAQARNVKNGKGRFVGLQFNLDDVPKEELKTLKMSTRFNGEGLEAVIKTDKRTIETHSVIGYRKESKPGFILKNTNFVSNSSQMGIITNLRNFDIILGIDTNSRIVKDELTHLGMAIQITKEDDGINFLIINMFKLSGNIIKPENQNWKNLIEYILAHENYSESLKYAIVVDSDLDKLPQYNARLLPIIENFFLPQNIQLIYASSDTPNDAITNQLIAACDKYSGLALDELEKS